MSGDDAFLTVLRAGQPDNGVPTRVDIKSLEDAIPWLESLKKYVQDHLIPDTSGMTLSKNYGELYFGGSDSSQLIWDGKHNGYVKAVVESYRDIAHALDTAAEATKTIVQNYKDAEHNNALDVAAVEKAFSDDSSGSTTTTSTTSTSGNSATDGTYA